MSLLAIIPIRTFTNLTKVHVVFAIATSTALMVCMSGRFVPAMAMLTASIEGRYRGGFMSINSAVQQFSAGIAAWISGMILGETRTGQITHFNWIGYISVGCALTCIWLARFIKPVKDSGRPAESLVAMEG
jgi:predicted MFS family arabinose efflux permease